MRTQSIGRAMAAILIVAVAVLTSATLGVEGAQAKGRYKKQGDKCVWDANDAGPNQCTPQTKGRFKRNGETCAWDANDTGADQCRPASGRFKKEGSACLWSAKDSGPDQCDPRSPK